MKKKVLITLVAAMTISLAACGNNTDNLFANTDKPEVTEAPEDTPVPDEPKVNEAPEVTEIPEVTPTEEPAEAKAPTNHELCTAYTQFIEEVAHESFTPDEMVVAAVDVNNDGIRELLYTECSVAASGVYVCYYDNGVVVPVGPFGTYGSIKYEPETGRIVSVNDNGDYMDYELISINDEYETVTEDKFSYYPDENDTDITIYTHNDKEISYEDYVEEFASLQALQLRGVEYNDMYWYAWCDPGYDPLFECIGMMLKDDEYGRNCSLVIPKEEMAKLVGTWDIYSVEIEGDVYYADQDSLEGKVVVNEDMTVDIYEGEDKPRRSGLRMNFVNGVYSDYFENTDWYIRLDGDYDGSDEFYISLTPDDKLFLNFINTEDYEYFISSWRYYTRKTN